MLRQSDLPILRDHRQPVPFLLLFRVALQNRFRSPPPCRRNGIPCASSLASSVGVTPELGRHHAEASRPPELRLGVPPARQRPYGRLRELRHARRLAMAPRRRSRQRSSRPAPQQAHPRSLLPRQRSQAAMDRERRLGIPHHRPSDARAARAEEHRSRLRRPRRLLQGLSQRQARPHRRQYVPRVASEREGRPQGRRKLAAHRLPLAHQVRR